MSNRAPELFRFCVEAMDAGVLIQRQSAQDKEFALQEWVQARLDEAGIAYVSPRRNTYPDFALVDEPEGYEVKGLATHTPKGTPGRLSTYDSNSAIPMGEHQGRTIYCVFGRYPQSTSNTYPLHDLVVCHADLLNPMRDYEHRNLNIPTFGAYGDLMIRDRKMYVVRTPYDIAEGTVDSRTLILPAGEAAPEGLVAVGRLERVEAEKIPVGYRFDLRTNQMTVIEEDNPTGGTRHTFTAYRVTGEEEPPVTLSRRRE
jgi:hypothetical protein